MFFRDRFGNFYPTSEIIKICTPQMVEGKLGTERRYQVDLRSGDSVHIGDYDRALIGRAVVAAFSTPHIEYVVSQDAKDDATNFKARVIGWAITAEEGLLPVTIDGINDGSETPVAVLLEDGSVIRYGVEPWPTLEAFLKPIN